MADLFKHTDYKELISEVVFENEATVGYKTRMAKAVGAPKSFISQVLHHFQCLDGCQAKSGELAWGHS